MFSRFFIDRPIFASVLSIVVTLTGAVAGFTLPVAQYPLIVPPSIIVQCTYPGASAQVVAESIAAPIEEMVNGVENMLYMSSQSGNDGTYSLTVVFKPGIDLNFAQVLVQNRVDLAVPQLPDVVRQAGVVTRKRNQDVLLIVSIYSPTGRYDKLYLSNFATINVVDELARVDGVGDIHVFGQQDYSMRVWVDPDHLASLGLTANDVIRSIREQNAEVASGVLGQPPSQSDQPFELAIKTQGRLVEPEEFEEIVLRTTAEGRKVRVKDIGRVVLGARNQDITSSLDGYPCANVALFQLPYANNIETAEGIKRKMEELKESFPEGVDYAIAYDTAPFIRESIDGVFRTLGEAVLLVALVVLVFLQNWRSSLIPLVAVPVAVIGTFAVMAVMGFSLNTLTLFGLVLAIGIVVDDAIVVVEAVEHHIEKGLSPRDAAYRAMEEVSGPVIAVAVVLSAVFVPCAFVSGVTGQFFRQFALTIAVSTVISAFNSLTLSPALAAILLQAREARKDVVGRSLDLGLGWFFRLFNWGFRRTTSAYTRVVGLALRGSVIVLFVYGGLVLLTFWTARRLPTGYIPLQDMGKLYAAIQLPDAASLQRSEEIVAKVARLIKETEGVKHTIAISGQSFTLSANGSNFGNIFISLEDFENRRDPSLTSDAIADEIRKKVAAEIPDALVTVLGPPPVNGLGNSGGFKFVVEDRSGDGDLVKLEAQTRQMIAASRNDPQLRGLFTVFRADSPQLYVDLNRQQCENMGVDPSEVFLALQVYLGSYYVNDVNLFGRTWPVFIQAEGVFRSDTEQVRRLMVRNKKGSMVPIGSVLTVEEISGPLLLSRYNGYPAIVVLGGTRPGVSSGQGIDAIQRLCKEHNLTYEWTEITFIQIEADKNVWNNLIFPFAVMFVFLALAALYESWALPLAVILVVPMCILGSLAGVAATRSDINIFTQIGFVVLVGLASKNAILIVEFAKSKRASGRSRYDAALEACQLRLRPILMTSFAFILGVVPLMVATGAGSEMRRMLGTAVFSGMLGVTLFGIFLTPVFFYVIEWMAEQPAFASGPAARVGRVALAVLGFATLGTFWLLLHGLGLMRRRPRAQTVRLPALQSLKQTIAAEWGRAFEPAPPNGDHKNGAVERDGSIPVVRVPDGAIPESKENEQRSGVSPTG